VSVLADESSPVRAQVQSFAAVNGWTFVPAPVSAESLREQAQAGVEVIVIAEPGLGPAIAEVAGEHPQSYFIALHAQVAEPPGNVLALGGPGDRIDQAGFLAGLVAGHATETERVAVFSDTTTPTGLKYRNGFLAGVRYACPQCQRDIIDMAGSEATEFAGGEGAKVAALGADVVFAAAGQAGEAALVAAAQNGAWVIGSPSSAVRPAEKTLTQVLMGSAPALAAALAHYRDGQPRAGVEPLSLANGSLGLEPFSPAADLVLSPLDRQEIEATIRKLADGSLETGVDPVTGEEK
jgi:basic membrane protein A